MDVCPLLGWEGAANVRLSSQDREKASWSRLILRVYISVQRPPCRGLPGAHSVSWLGARLLCLARPGCEMCFWADGPPGVGVGGGRGWAAAKLTTLPLSRGLRSSHAGGEEPPSLPLGGRVLSTGIFLEPWHQTEVDTPRPDLG